MAASDLCELFCSENFSNITHLDVSYNYKLGDEGVFALCDKPFTRSLTTLNLEKCNITIESLKYIAENKFMGNLVDLDISNNEKVQLQTFFYETDNIKMFSMMNRIKVIHCGLDESEVENLNDEFKLKCVKEEQHEEVDDRYLLDDNAFNPKDVEDVSISEDDL